MATVLCVLYDDPVDGYPTVVRARRRSRRSSATTAARPRRRRRRSTSRPASCSAASPASSGCAAFLEERGHRFVVTVGQGRARLGVRARAARRRRRDLAAVLARVPDRRAHREGAEPEARDHGGHRLRPRRPAGRDRARHHRRRGDVLQQHQRVRARRDDDPRARAQLHPVVPVGRRRRLEHRRLRRRARTTSRGCRSARSAPAGSAPPCCGG